MSKKFLGFDFFSRHSMCNLCLMPFLTIFALLQLSSVYLLIPAFGKITMLVSQLLIFATDEDKNEQNINIEAVDDGA